MAQSAGWTTRMTNTRVAIESAALALFDEHGFHEVSVADIAAAAGVGERTVYRYFPKKEDTIFGDDFKSFVEALDSIPEDLPPTKALFHLISQGMVDEEQAESEHLQLRLILSTPFLRSAWVARLEAIEKPLAEWLSRRTGLAADSIELKVAAAAIVTGNRVVVEEWNNASAEHYMELTGRTLAALGIGLDQLGPN